MDINTFIEQEIENRMRNNDLCGKCAFFHTIDGNVMNPKGKYYCLFAYDCLIGHKRRFIPNGQFDSYGHLEAKNE